MRLLVILCLMCASLAANPVLSEKTGNNREILKLYTRMESSIRPQIGDEDWQKYRLAIEFASTKHEGQYRKDKNKTPYIIHPMGVSYSLFREGDVRDLDVLISGLLHDTLEDTDTTFEEISTLFGEKVAKIITELTNDPHLTTEENKQRQVDHAPHLSQGAKLVKLSDRLYNVRDLNVPPPSWDAEKVSSYLNWGKKLLAALKGTNKNLEDALQNEIQWQESHTLETSQNFFVGELGDKWTFESDHLPIGVKIGNHIFGSWNILATPYLHYIEKNEQGLKDSLILKLNRYSNSKITDRENLILNDLNHFTNTYSILTLQEVTPEMYFAIKTLLPSNFAIYPETEPATELVVIYDSTKFNLLKAQNHPFQKHPKRSLMVLDLQDTLTDQPYRFVATHLPGALSAKQSRIELTQYLLRNFEPNTITILMGDMNGSPKAIQNQFERSAELLHIDLPFKNIAVNYPTHINTVMEASYLDQIYVAGAEGAALEGSAFYPEVTSIVNLLESLKP